MFYLEEEYKEIQNEEFEYDAYGRLLYHPELHDRHGKPWDESELEYICKFAGDKSSVLAFAIGRPMTSISAKLWVLKNNGLFDYYKNLNKYW